jgi:hypothetical protein
MTNKLSVSERTKIMLGIAYPLHTDKNSTNVNKLEGESTPKSIHHRRRYCTLPPEEPLLRELIPTGFKGDINSESVRF